MSSTLRAGGQTSGFTNWLATAGRALRLTQPKSDWWPGRQTGAALLFPQTAKAILTFIKKLRAERATRSCSWSPTSTNNRPVGPGMVAFFSIGPLIPRHRLIYGSYRFREIGHRFRS